MTQTPPGRPDDPPITLYLDQAREGDREALARVWETVLSDFRGLASSLLARERKAQDFQTTMLFNDVYLKMHGDGDVGDFANRRVFFAAVRKNMSDVLIDAAKARNAQKRGGGWGRVSFEFADHAFVADVEGTIDHGEAIGAALDALEEEDPVAHEVAWLRLVGLDRRHVAEVLELEPTEVDRHWKYARVFLQDFIEQCDQ